MFKNWITIISVVALTICLKTVNSIYCYSCGSSIYECSDQNEISKAKCGRQFSSCANIVKFFKNGTSVVSSSFCYGQLKNDIERECREDTSQREEMTCKIICNHDYCNSFDKFFTSPFGRAHEHEHEIFNIKPAIKTTTQNMELNHSSSYYYYSNKFLVLISLFTSFGLLKFQT